MNIWEIVKQLDTIFANIEEADGELTESNEALLDLASEDLENKINGYSYYIKELTAKNKLIKDEIETFRNRIKANENKINYLKNDILIPVLKKYGEKTDKNTFRYKTDTRSLWTVNRKLVELDEDFSDEYYMKYSLHLLELNDKDNNILTKIINDKGYPVKAEQSPIKSKIKKDLDDDIEIDGARLIERTSLTIR